MKKISYFLVAMSVGAFFLSSYNTDAAPQKKKVVTVQCSPLFSRAGGNFATVTGKISLKLINNGAYVGQGNLSISVSQGGIRNGGIILEEKDIPVEAYFDDILLPTLQAVPARGVNSKISTFFLFQKNPEAEKPLYSRIETKDNEVYETDCELKY